MPLFQILAAHGLSLEFLKFSFVFRAKHLIVEKLGADQNLFNINLPTYIANRNIVSNATGDLYTEDKDTIVSNNLTIES